MHAANPMLCWFTSPKSLGVVNGCVQLAALTLILEQL